MTRGIWTKWIIGAAFLLLIVAAGCFLYYQHTTAQYKSEAYKDDKLLEKWKVDKAKPPTPAETESTKPPVESTTPTVEKSTIETPGTKVEMTGTGTPTQTQASAQIAETAEVLVSSFGPYPEVPEDYFRQPSWLRYPNGVPNDAAGPFEIMDRVLIKLWNQGHKNITGASFSGEKVYPHFANTAYVRYKETILPDGTVYRRVTQVKGGPDIFPFAKQIKKGNTPAHIKLLDIDSAGINPFTFLERSD